MNHRHFGQVVVRVFRAVTSQDQSTTWVMPTSWISKKKHFLKKVFNKIIHKNDNNKVSLWYASRHASVLGDEGAQLHVFWESVLIGYKYSTSRASRFPYIYIYIYIYTRVGTLIVATIYLQLIQNRYMFQSFTVLQCSHQHCLQPVASDVEVVEYL